MVLIKNLTADASFNIAQRPTLEKIAHDAAIGRTRFSELYRMFYTNGPGNGSMLSLPFDQLVEHGIGHALSWERAADPRAVIELANKGNFSALALSIGQAEKYQNLIYPNVPLIIKVDGHFLVGEEVPYERQSTMASIERALNAGANAIGFTFYLGGKETESDTERVAGITELAHRFGKPVFMWAYTRGPLPSAMGEDSLYWCAQGISAAESIGVDVVKQKFPAFVKGKKKDSYIKNLSEGSYLHNKMPDVEKLLELEPEDPENASYELHVKRLSFLAQVAPNTLKIYSGGPKYTDIQKDLVDTTRAVMDSGNEGRIIGRNLWARPIEEALPLLDQIIAIMRKEKYHRPLKEERFSKPLS
jgi:class I fructose-bisphosphate aldolase